MDSLPPIRNGRPTKQIFVTQKAERLSILAAYLHPTEKARERYPLSLLGVHVARSEVIDRHQPA